MYVDLRIRVQDHTVDEATAIQFLQEFILGKFSFIEAVAPLKNDGFGTLLPDESSQLTRADRPIQNGEGI